MPHTYAQNIIHVVFSTKDRRKTISPEFQPKMWAYAAGICRQPRSFCWFANTPIRSNDWTALRLDSHALFFRGSDRRLSRLPPASLVQL